VSKKLVPGINHITNADYHADKTRLSSSGLKKILDSPKLFHEEVILRKSEQKHIAAFDEGSYVHSLILEPEAIAKEYAFFDGMRKAGKDWEAFKKMHENKIKLSKPQKMRCKSYHNAFKKNKAAVALVVDGFAEHTICEDLLDVPIKVRTDYINVEKGYIADVKTSGFPVDKDSFRQTINQYSYDLSAAMYCMAAEQYYKKPFDFYFICISKKELNCEVFKVSQDTMRKGRSEVTKALELYKHCLKTGEWKSLHQEQPMEYEGDYEILEI